MNRKIFCLLSILFLVLLFGCGSKERESYLSADYEVEEFYVAMDTTIYDVCETTQNVHFIVRKDAEQIGQKEIEIREFCTETRSITDNIPLSTELITVNTIEGEQLVLERMAVTPAGNHWLLVRYGKMGNLQEGRYGFLFYDVEKETMEEIVIRAKDFSDEIISGMCSLGEDKICVYSAGGRVYGLDFNGEAVFKEQINGEITGKASGLNGRTLLIGYENGRHGIYEINAEGSNMNCITRIDDVQGIIKGGVELAEKVYLFWTKDELFVWDANEGELCESCKWYELGINGENIKRLCVSPDGKIVLYRKEFENGKNSILFTVLTPMQEMNEEKKVLKYAVYNGVSYQGMERIEAYNALPNEYSIEIIDYKVSGGTYEDSVMHLQAEIAAGNGPDIIDITAFDFEHLSDGQVLEELDSYMEQDDSFNREDYFDNILKYYQRDGKTLGVITDFRVIVGMVDSDIYQKHDNWTVDTLYQCMDENPEIQVMFGDYRSNVFNLFLCSRERFWNPETRLCDFASEEFIKLLKYSYKYGYDRTKLPEDSTFPETILVEKCYAYDPVYSQFYEQRGLLPVGFRMGENGGAFIGKSGMGLALATYSEHKQEAWEFIKFCLSEDMQNADKFPGMAAFPVKRSNFDKVLAAWMAEESEIQTGEKRLICTFMEDEVGYETYAITEQEKEDFVKMIEGLSLMEHVDTILFNIIMEEADFYFSGAKPVEEVVDIIQNRAKLYMDEISY